MKKLYCALLLFLIPMLRINAQLIKNVPLNIEALAGYTSADNVPFWMRANQYGSVPLDKASMSIIGSARKDYDTACTGLLGWGASFEGRLNVGHKTTFTLIEGYGKVRIGIFELRAGRDKEIMGLCDTSLTSGAWAISGNALGIPKVQLAVPEFYTIPWFGKLFAFKGQIAYGWLGDITMYRRDAFDRYDHDTIQIRSYFHQKSLYGRFGKPSWRFKLYGGFNHQVFWANQESFYGDVFTLSPFETFVYVLMGKSYYNDSIPTHSKIGNHLGSIDLGLEYRFSKVKVLIYRQNFYEVGNLYYLANIQDGLNGISFENQNTSDNLFRWKKFLFEFLYTKNQAGEPWSPETPTPYENYYNNHQYILGWSYNDVGLGTPFISPKSTVRKELASCPRDYFSNNRVKVFHIGFEGSVQKWDYMLKASWSRNYGSYMTTNDEQTTGYYNPGSTNGFFRVRDQLSTYIECNRLLKNGFNVGCLAAFDVGELFYDSFGFLFNVSKSF